MPGEGKSRAPHKEDCQCRVCTAVRAKAAREAQPDVPEAEVKAEAEVEELVEAGSLKPGNIFEFADKSYRAGRKDTDFILAVSVAEPGTVPITLGLNTMVKLV